MANNNSWDRSQLRNYNIELEQIPRVPFNDVKVHELIAQDQPVVMTGSRLVRSALHWDLDYLADNIGTADCTIFTSNDHVFKYYDEKKLPNYHSAFIPPIKRKDMCFQEFVEKLRSWAPGRDRLYLQQPLHLSVGPNIVRDFLNFNWRYCDYLQREHSWGPLTSNLLLVAQEGNVTPCHYDEQENLFAQIQGFKRCILFPPSQFECLYPHPVYHPHDRQSMVNFDDPDLIRFPKFREAKGFETVLEPGEVLYIPIYWWHHIESLMNGGETVTVNFWYKGEQNVKVTYPLKDHQQIAIMRNIEKMVTEVMQNNHEVGQLFRAMVLGRYTD